jgi:PAS domain S-box-containing protein
VLSTTLALIPAMLLPNVTESRLAVFAVAVMVSAWYGGWKPGLVATSFALTVSAYFSFSSEQTPAQFRSTMMRLALFVVLAALICWFNAALRAAQESLRRSEMNFRSLVTNAPYGICRCDSAGELLDVNPALLAVLGYSSAQELLGKHLGGLYADTNHWFELADHLHSAAPFNGLIAEWKRKDGSSTVVRISGRAVNGDKEKSFELEDAFIEPGTETILLAEDEANLRYLARQFLEKQGYKVIEAADGAVAMQIAVAHEGVIHLLLTDVIMPGMNGRELAQRITEIRPNTKVLYMSGYTENVIGHNGTLDAGVRLLQKPFTLRDLKSKVREVLDSTPIDRDVDVPVQAAHASPSRGREQPSQSRAQRFQLNLPLKYRRLDEERWHEGETKNISRSGLLFQAEDLLQPQLLQPNVQLEINLVLPAEIAGLSPTEVVCRGEIVRTVKAAGEEMPPALAAKILQYHFQHGSQLPRA